jgi:hypothetical protein
MLGESLTNDLVDCPLNWVESAPVGVLACLRQLKQGRSKQLVLVRASDQELGQAYQKSLLVLPI